MDNFDRINLEKMIKSNNVENYTDEIRKKKHSNLINNDIEKLLNIKKNYKELQKKDNEKFDNLCINQCEFLFKNYTDIFNKIKKDEIDLKILAQFLTILKKIENEEIDQHEGSFIVGKLLKDLYIDSALKKSEKLDKINNEEKKEFKEPIKNINYKEFKNIKLN